MQTTSFTTSGARNHTKLIKELYGRQLTTTDSLCKAIFLALRHTNPFEKETRRNSQGLARSWRLVHSLCREDVCVFHQSDGNFSGKGTEFKYMERSRMRN